MTENEAIEELKYDCNEIGKAIPCDTSWGKSFENAYAMAINALEEVQQYRAIGTLEELITAMKYVRLAKAHRTVGKAIEECAKYEEIGTPEECREAVEKQTAKKVKSISQVKDGDSYVGLIGRCPCCGDILEEDTVYCDCGQRLDWGTSDEID